MSPQAHGAAGEALGTLYARHCSWLVAWLQRRINCREGAADIAQDTFMRIWASAKAQAFEDIREPRAYLRTVAQRLMINHIERLSLERAYLASLQHLTEETALSPEARAILLETLIELDALLAGLPPKIRAAFLLSQLDGLTYEEIASRMHLSVRTVTRYMAQGFRQCLSIMLDS
ncbi:MULTISPECIES: sigma-70 family RNA polymerase sigma factor [Pseudomonas]|uniref:Sigma-70 family RNA polymerase sigma factor n=1 Tax=Pseudomonas juntendi TaxID=2666183 RepID=A0A7W2KEK2_9PSED|nr:MULTISPECIES: sigma-70 family RNA polymerase sigma factor [Pseudomonas]MBA6097081.1 sigma-70 family RNA polymerase sigma factor [Pseudomonas juntendi]